MTKGDETEDLAQSIYQAAGYRVWTPPKAKYRSQDIFGLYDLLCVGLGRVVAVQCKTNSGRGIQAWSDDAWCLDKAIESWHSEYAVRYEDEGWRILRPDSEEYHTAFDGREIDETPAPLLRDVLRRDE
jgi:arabinogalactan endo-1,4-beta-galactosidase